jgi:hypothetical protein
MPAGAYPIDVTPYLTALKNTSLHPNLASSSPFLYQNNNIILGKCPQRK